MKKYDKHAKCVKCGEQGASTELRSTAHIRTEPHRIAGIQHTTFSLLRTCTNCGFKWQEATLDDEEASSGSSGTDVNSPDFVGSVDGGAA